MLSVRSIVRAIDWTIIISISILMVIGILFIYSSGVTSTGDIVSSEYIKQIVWVLSGIMILLASVLIDTKRTSDYIPVLYAGFVIVLVYTRLFGKVVNGARSWIGIIGDYGIQPSEFMKIATCLFLAYYLEKSNHEAASFKRFAISAAIVALPIGLILLQPDFGTALVFIPIYLSMAYVGGINRQYLLFFLISGGFSIIIFLFEKAVTKNRKSKCYY